MFIQYTANNGVYSIGSETLISLADFDSVQGGNLLTNPGDVSSWTTGNSATLSQEVNVEPNKVLKLTNGAASSGYGSQAVPTTANTYYLFRAYSYNNDSITSYISAGTTIAGTSLGISLASSDSKIHEILIKASGSTTYFTVANTATSGAISYWSNMEVIELQKLTSSNTISDLTVNALDLSVAGEIAKIPIHYNNDACAFGNYSTANTVTLAYNALLDPTTGAFSFATWFKREPNSAVEYLFARDSSTTAQRYYIRIETDGTITGGVDDNSTDRTATSTTTCDDYTWHQAAVTYSSGTVKLYIDKVLAATTTGTALSTITNTSATLSLGNNITAGSSFGGFLALTKIDIGTEWTETQITSMYDSESVLFDRDVVYSVVGNTINYTVYIEGISPNLLTDKVFNESRSGKRETFINNQKKSYNFNVLPYDDDQYKYAEHFLKTTEDGIQFTIDIHGSQYAPYKQLAVIKTSTNETQEYAGYNSWKYNFSVREV